MGASVVASAATQRVHVRSSFAPKHTCYHNKYGIIGVYDGEYPSTSPNSDYILKHSDTCLAVSVSASDAHGFKFRRLVDAPRSNSDWPNVWYNGPPFLSVWLC